MNSNNKNKNNDIISKDLVKHVADLANLGLSNKELIKFRDQLSSILNFVNNLNQVDTTNVEPTSQVTGLVNVFRKDEVKPSLSVDDALKNAPGKHEHYFKVNAVLEE